VLQSSSFGLLVSFAQAYLRSSSFRMLAFFFADLDFGRFYTP
jgi:hypothetical protein